MVVLFICLGFLREYIFVNVNVVLYNKLHNESYPVPYTILFFNRFDYYTVYAMKWGLTSVFALLFFFAQRYTLKILFPEKIIVKWLFYFYLILLLLSVIAFGAGYLSGNTEGGYRFSRMFMGILQSPVPLMFLIPAGVLKSKFDKA